MTPVRGLTTKWSVSCMPYFTGDPSGSWPFRTNTSVPTLVDSESGKPAGYPAASRIGGSFTLLPAGTTRKERLFSRVYCRLYRSRAREIPSRYSPCVLSERGLFISPVNSLTRCSKAAATIGTSLRGRRVKYARCLATAAAFVSKQKYTGSNTISRRANCSRVIQ